MLRKELDLLLMGIPGEFFIYDDQRDLIRVSNFDKKLKGVTKRCLNNLLATFELPATQIFKLQKLARNLRLNPQQNSFTNSTLLTILDEYLTFINQVVLDVPQDFTLLQYQQELLPLFQELSLIFDIFYRPTLLRTSNISDLEVEAFKQTAESPDTEISPKARLNSADTENLNMLFHLLCSL